MVQLLSLRLLGRNVNRSRTELMYRTEHPSENVSVRNGMEFRKGEPNGTRCVQMVSDQLQKHLSVRLI